MAVRLGYDAPLLAAIAGRLERAVMQDMRRRVKQQHGLASVASLHAGVPLDSMSSSFILLLQILALLGRLLRLCVSPNVGS